MSIKKIISHLLASIIAWFLFTSAILTTGTALWRNITGGFLGWQQETLICLWVAFCFTIWYNVVGSRRKK